MSIANRPAVSTINTSRPSRFASASPAAAVCTGSPGAENTGTPICAPSTFNCSTAAGRCKSAPTNNGLRPCALNHDASFAALVVLPEPCKPAINTTVGGCDAYEIFNVSPPSMATSSALTILMICWPGSSASETLLPTACTRMRSTTSRTTPMFTSASSNAVRISASISFTSASVNRPLPRMRLNTPPRRSLKLSNITPLQIRLG